MAQRESPAPALELSPPQLAVTDHRGAHLQVIACAGAPKADSASRRIASLVHDGVEPAANHPRRVVPRGVATRRQWLFLMEVHPFAEPVDQLVHPEPPCPF